MNRRFTPVLAAALYGVIAFQARAVEFPAFSFLNEGDTFRAANLTAAEQGEVIEQAEKISFDAPESWQTELRIRRVSLGATDGLVVQGTRLLCGATGNCEIALLRRSMGKWTALFADAPIGDGFGFLRQSTRGLPDFVVRSNLSAAASRFVVYKFDGLLYRATQCYDARGAALAESGCSK